MLPLVLDHRPPANKLRSVTALRWHGLCLVALVCCNAGIGQMLVHCIADGGHNAVEVIGHAAGNASDCHAHDTQTTCTTQEHDHHPDDCRDRELGAMAQTPRDIQVDLPTVDAACAACSPVTIDARPMSSRSGDIVQLRPRPPPPRDPTLGELATVILLI